MSTAHRPTWAPAKGGAQDAQSGSRVFAPTKYTSAKDQASHTKMKFRQPGQSAPSDLKEKDYKLELEEKERAAKRGRLDQFNEERVKDLLLLESGDAGAGAASGPGRPKALVPRALDADDEAPATDSDEDSDEEDEEAELLAELERIRGERAAEAAAKAAAEAGAAAQQRRDELLTGNPLLGGSAAPASFQVKRRWDDDVVFRNQTRGEAKPGKRFVNDTIRNDFHRRFLTRYVR